MLQQLDADLWVTERPLRFGGVEIGTRMSVIRLADGALFLHSPVAADAALRKELDALGRVRFVVAPNRMHHLYAGEWSAAYPDARLFAAPGLDAKRKDLVIDAMLGDEAPDVWRGQIEQLFFQGFPMANEVVFFHPSSRSLLTSDLCFNFGTDAPFARKLGFRLLGMYGRPGPSRLERVLIRNRAAARRSLERILAWDFDRIVLAHGEVLPSGGREALRAGYAWLG